MSRLRWPNSRHSLSDVPGTVQLTGPESLSDPLLNAGAARQGTLLFSTQQRPTSCATRLRPCNAATPASGAGDGPVRIRRQWPLVARRTAPACPLPASRRGIICPFSLIMSLSPGSTVGPYTNLTREVVSQIIGTGGYTGGHWRQERNFLKTLGPAVDLNPSRSPHVWWPVLKCRSMAGFEVSTEAPIHGCPVAAGTRSAACTTSTRRSSVSPRT